MKGETRHAYVIKESEPIPKEQNKSILLEEHSDKTIKGNFETEKLDLLPNSGGKFVGKDRENLQREAIIRPQQTGKIDFKSLQNRPKFSSDRTWPDSKDNPQSPSGKKTRDKGKKSVKSERSNPQQLYRLSITIPRSNPTIGIAYPQQKVTQPKKLEAGKGPISGSYRFHVPSVPEREAELQQQELSYNRCYQEVSSSCTATNYNAQVASAVGCAPVYQHPSAPQQSPGSLQPGVHLQEFQGNGQAWPPPEKVVNGASYGVSSQKLGNFPEGNKTNSNFVPFHYDYPLLQDTSAQSFSSDQNTQSQEYLDISMASTQMTRTPFLHSTGEGQQNAPLNSQFEQNKRGLPDSSTTYSQVENPGVVLGSINNRNCPATDSNQRLISEAGGHHTQKTAQSQDPLSEKINFSGKDCTSTLMMPFEKFITSPSTKNTNTLPQTWEGSKTFSTSEQHSAQYSTSSEKYDFQCHPTPKNNRVPWQQIHLTSVVPNQNRLELSRQLGNQKLLYPSAVPDWQDSCEPQRNGSLNNSNNFHGKRLCENFSERLEPLYFGVKQPFSRTSCRPSSHGLTQVTTVGLMTGSPCSSPLPSPIKNAANNSSCSSLSPTTSPINLSSEDIQLPIHRPPPPLYHQHQEGKALAHPDHPNSDLHHFHNDISRTFPTQERSKEDILNSMLKYKSIDSIKGCMQSHPVNHHPPPSYSAHQLLTSSLANANLDQLDVLLTCKQCDQNFNNLSSVLDHKQYCGIHAVSQKTEFKNEPKTQVPLKVPNESTKGNPSSNTSMSRCPSDLHLSLLGLNKNGELMSDIEMKGDPKDDPSKLNLFGATNSVPLPDLDLDDAKLDSLITEALNGLGYQSDNSEIDSSFIDAFADDEISTTKVTGSMQTVRSKESLMFDGRTKHGDVVEEKSQFKGLYDLERDSVNLKNKNRGNLLDKASQHHRKEENDRACSATKLPEEVEKDIKNVGDLDEKKHKKDPRCLFSSRFTERSNIKSLEESCSTVRPNIRQVAEQKSAGKESKRRKTGGGTWSKELIHKIVQQKNKFHKLHADSNKSPPFSLVMEKFSPAGHNPKFEEYDYVSDSDDDCGPLKIVRQVRLGRSGHYKYTYSKKYKGREKNKKEKEIPWIDASKDILEDKDTSLSTPKQISNYKVRRRRSSRSSTSSEQSTPTSMSCESVYSPKNTDSDSEKGLAVKTISSSNVVLMDYYVHNVYETSTVETCKDSSSQVFSRNTKRYGSAKFLLSANLNSCRIGMESTSELTKTSSSSKSLTLYNSKGLSSQEKEQHCSALASVLQIAEERSHLNREDRKVNSIDSPSTGFQTKKIHVEAIQDMNTTSIMRKSETPKDDGSDYGSYCQDTRGGVRSTRETESASNKQTSSFDSDEDANHSTHYPAHVEEMQSRPAVTQDSTVQKEAVGHGLVPYITETNQSMVKSPVTFDTSSLFGDLTVPGFDSSLYTDMQMNNENFNNFAPRNEKREMFDSKFSTFLKPKEWGLMADPIPLLQDESHHFTELSDKAVVKKASHNQLHLAMQDKLIDYNANISEDELEIKKIVTELESKLQTSKENSSLAISGELSKQLTLSRFSPLRLDHGDENGQSSSTDGTTIEGIIMPNTSSTADSHLMEPYIDTDPTWSSPFPFGLLETQQCENSEEHNHSSLGQSCVNEQSEEKTRSPLNDTEVNDRIQKSPKELVEKDVYSVNPVTCLEVLSDSVLQKDSLITKQDESDFSQFLNSEQHTKNKQRVEKYNREQNKKTETEKLQEHDKIPAESSEPFPVEPNLNFVCANATVGYKAESDKRPTKGRNFNQDSEHCRLETTNDNVKSSESSYLSATTHCNKSEDSSGCLSPVYVGLKEVSSENGLVHSYLLESFTSVGQKEVEHNVELFQEMQTISACEESILKIPCNEEFSISDTVLLQPNFNVPEKNKLEDENNLSGIVAPTIKQDTVCGPELSGLMSSPFKITCAERTLEAEEECMIPKNTSASNSPFSPNVVPIEKQNWNEFETLSTAGESLKVNNSEINLHASPVSPMRTISKQSEHLFDQATENKDAVPSAQESILRCNSKLLHHPQEYCALSAALNEHVEIQGCVRRNSKDGSDNWQLSLEVPVTFSPSASPAVPLHVEKTSEMALSSFDTSLQTNDVQMNPKCSFTEACRETNVPHIESAARPCGVDISQSALQTIDYMDLNVSLLNKVKCDHLNLSSPLIPNQKDTCLNHVSSDDKTSECEESHGVQPRQTTPLKASGGKGKSALSEEKLNSNDKNVFQKKKKQGTILCEICSACFRSGPGLKRHKAIKHTAKKESPPAALTNQKTTETDLSMEYKSTETLNNSSSDAEMSSSIDRKKTDMNRNGKFEITECAQKSCRIQNGNGQFINGPVNPDHYSDELLHILKTDILQAIAPNFPKYIPEKQEISLGNSEKTEPENTEAEQISTITIDHSSVHEHLVSLTPSEPKVDAHLKQQLISRNNTENCAISSNDDKSTDIFSEMNSGCKSPFPKNAVSTETMTQAPIEIKCENNTCLTEDANCQGFRESSVLPILPNTNLEDLLDDESTFSQLFPRDEAIIRKKCARVYGKRNKKQTLNLSSGDVSTVNNGKQHSNTALLQPEDRCKYETISMDHVATLERCHKGSLETDFRVIEDITENKGKAMDDTELCAEEMPGPKDSDSCKPMIGWGDSETLSDIADQRIPSIESEAELKSNNTVSDSSGPHIQKDTCDFNCDDVQNCKTTFQLSEMPTCESVNDMPELIPISDDGIEGSHGLSLFKKPTECKGKKRHEGGLKPRDKQYKCKVCFTWFLTLGELNFHKLSHNPSPPPTCYMCVQRKFSSREQLRDHLREKHAKNKAGIWTCGMCLKEISDVWMYNEHLREHATQFARKGQTQSSILGLPGCFMQETAVKNFITSIMQHRPSRFITGDVGKANGVKENVDQESKVKEGDESTQIKNKGHSEGPGKEIVTSTSDILHKSEPTPKVEMHPNCKDPSRDCHHCGKQFPKPFKLQRHLVVHSLQRIYLCHKCPVFYQDVKDLKDHLRKEHGEAEEHDSKHTTLYTCELCADVMHVIKKSFICSTCNYTFSKKEQFDRHMEKHLTGGNQIFKFRGVARPSKPSFCTTMEDDFHLPPSKKSKTILDHQSSPESNCEARSLLQKQDVEKTLSNTLLITDTSLNNLPGEYFSENKDTTIKTEDITEDFSDILNKLEASQLFSSQSACLSPTVPKIEKELLPFSEPHANMHPNNVGEKKNKSPEDHNDSDDYMTGNDMPSLESEYPLVNCTINNTETPDCSENMLKDSGSLLEGVTTFNAAESSNSILTDTTELMDDTAADFASSTIKKLEVESVHLESEIANLSKECDSSLISIDLQGEKREGGEKEQQHLDEMLKSEHKDQKTLTSTEQHSIGLAKDKTALKQSDSKQVLESTKFASAGRLTSESTTNLKSRKRKELKTFQGLKTFQPSKVPTPVTRENLDVDSRSVKKARFQSPSKCENTGGGKKGDSSSDYSVLSSVRDDMTSNKMFGKHKAVGLSFQPKKSSFDYPLKKGENLRQLNGDYKAKKGIHGKSHPPTRASCSSVNSSMNKYRSLGGVRSVESHSYRTAESQNHLLSQLFGQKLTSFKIPLRKDTSESLN